jgi:Holliday junction resolvase
MSHPNKLKGNRFEKEIVELLKRYGFKADRCWGSNGKSRGLNEEVDIVADKNINGKEYKFFIQCKSKKALPAYLKPADDIHFQVFKENRGKAYMLIELDKLISGSLFDDLEKDKHENISCNGNSGEA